MGEKGTGQTVQKLTGLCDQTNGKKIQRSYQVHKHSSANANREHQEASPLQRPHHTQSFAGQSATMETVVVTQTTNLVAT